MTLFQDQRPRFFEGQYLGAEDLTAAVAYGRVQNARHALGAHTWGIAMGLQLKETPLSGGKVEVHILPGYAWDGFGRPVVVLSPYRISEALFSSITFQSGVDDTDAGKKGRLFPVWLRYDESATQNVRPGFEVCDTDDQSSRVRETFVVEIGTKPAHIDRHDPVRLAGQSVDAEQALKWFDPAAPAVYDESVPQQMLPEEGERARWLIPIGYVRWLPVQNQPGSFVARDDADRPAGSPDPVKDSDKIRAFRRYIGVVAEAVEAADGAIRLRDRYKAPSNTYRTPLTVTDPNNPPVNDLVWVEGHLRVLGDARLAGGRLDFRDATGEDAGVPLKLQRTGDNPPGDRALQVLLGSDSQTKTRFAVGPLKADNSVDEKFVVLSGGNVGIGTSDPSLKLGIEGDFGRDGGAATLHLWGSQIGDVDNGVLFLRSGGSVVAFDGNDSVGIGTNAPNHALTIQGNTGTYLNVRADDGAYEVLLGADSNGGIVSTMTNHDLQLRAGNNATRMVIKAGGEVGIGTLTPAGPLHVFGPGDQYMDISSTEAGQPYTRLMAVISTGVTESHLEFKNRLLLVAPLSGVSRLTVLESGNVGIGTNNPARRLHVFGDRIRLESAGKRLDLRADGSAVDLHSETDDLYLRSSGSGGKNRIIMNPFPDDGDVGIGLENPVCKLHVMDDINAAATNLDAHVAVIENTNTGDNADVLALKVGTATTGAENNYITFFAGNTAEGAIEGRPLGSGISLNSSGADFAECLPRLHPDEMIEPGDVVGVFAGKITRVTAGAHHVMAITGRPIVVANAPRREHRHLYGEAAFIGQVAVKVRGPVQAGDYIVPSGLNDGEGVAVPPDRITPEQAAQTVGRAWESVQRPGVKPVNAVIGVSAGVPGAALLSQLRTQEEEITALRAELRALRDSVRQML